MDKVNKWLMLVANLGVIAGIIFLAIEIQQNNSLLEAQTSYNYFKARDDKLMLQASDPILGSIASKARLGEDLTTEELTRFNIFISSVIYTWEYEWKEYEAGRYTFEQLNLQNKALDFNNPAFKTHNLWLEMKPRLSPSFNEFVEDYLIQE